MMVNGAVALADKHLEPFLDAIWIAQDRLT